MVNISTSGDYYSISYYDELDNETKFLKIGRKVLISLINKVVMEEKNDKAMV
jgi:hypothetical protein